MIDKANMKDTALRRGELPKDNHTMMKILTLTLWMQTKCW